MNWIELEHYDWNPWWASKMVSLRIGPKLNGRWTEDHISVRKLHVNQSPTKIQLRPPAGFEERFWILKVANLILACKWHFFLTWLLELIRFSGSHSYLKLKVTKQIKFHKLKTLGTCMYHSLKGEHISSCGFQSVVIQLRWLDHQFLVQLTYTLAKSFWIHLCCFQPFASTP
jgi:hypothetical protein